MRRHAPATAAILLASASTLQRPPLTRELVASVPKSPCSPTLAPALADEPSAASPFQARLETELPSIALELDGG